MATMSNTLVRPKSNRSLIQQDPKNCGCKTVSLKFSCGHIFVRVSLCSRTIDSPEQNQHPRREVILESRNVCAECILTTYMCHDELAAQVAACELSEHGSPPKPRIDGDDEEVHETAIDQDSRFVNGVLGETVESTLGSVGESASKLLHNDPIDLISSADAYRLPAVAYDPHTSEARLALDEYRQAYGRRSEVASWIDDTNDFFDTETSAEDLLLDWLRSETLQDSDDHNDESALIGPVSPLQYLDDPYDTSASSCARTSDGTVRRYSHGVEEAFRIPNWVEQLHDEPGDTDGNASPRNHAEEVQYPQLIETRGISWPNVPIIHITKSGPPLSMFNKPRTPKKSFTKVLKTSITKTCRIISTRLFTKQGIDGRVLQRRDPVSVRNISLFSRVERGSRTERKAEALRIKMLKQRYAEKGYRKVAAPGMFREDFSGDVEGDDRTGIVEKEMFFGRDAMVREDSKSWMTSTT